MAFIAPVRVSGSLGVFREQFAAGWSSPDFDGDPHVAYNCASYYSNVTQHYSNCWAYNLGSDADAPFLDGGVGPHVSNSILVELGLSLPPGNGNYSRVNRITRYVRW
ncbi:MAG TPA: hypothetical protein VNO30_20050 [Kofleriaceae bacterium]|nr:hypothetical protein [Kofleriaceae bacterium]